MNFYLHKKRRTLFTFIRCVFCELNLHKMQMIQPLEKEEVSSQTPAPRTQTMGQGVCQQWRMNGLWGWGLVGYSFNHLCQHHTNNVYETQTTHIHPFPTFPFTYSPFSFSLLLIHAIYYTVGTLSNTATATG